MYEVYYKCFYRDQWYWDSNQDSPEAAVSRAAGLNQSSGRATVVTVNGATLWAAPQTRNPGIAVPVSAGAMSYLD